MKTKEQVLLKTSFTNTFLLAYQGKKNESLKSYQQYLTCLKELEAHFRPTPNEFIAFFLQNNKDIDKLFEHHDILEKPLFDFFCICSTYKQSPRWVRFDNATITILKKLANFFIDQTFDLIYFVDNTKYENENKDNEDRSSESYQHYLQIIELLPQIHRPKISDFITYFLHKNNDLEKLFACYCLLEDPIRYFIKCYELYPKKEVFSEYQDTIKQICQFVEDKDQQKKLQQKKFTESLAEHIVKISPPRVEKKRKEIEKDEMPLKKPCEPLDFFTEKQKENTCDLTCLEQLGPSINDPVIETTQLSVNKPI